MGNICASKASTRGPSNASESAPLPSPPSSEIINPMATPPSSPTNKGPKIPTSENRVARSASRLAASQSETAALQEAATLLANKEAVAAAAAAEKQKEVTLLAEAEAARATEEKLARDVKEKADHESALNAKAEQATEAAEVERLEAAAKVAAAATSAAVTLSIASSTANSSVVALLNSRKDLLAAQSWSPARLFAIFDHDSNGTLDKEEVTKALTAILERVPTEEQLAVLYGKYDKNNDGLFDITELQAMCRDDLLAVKMKKASFFSAPKAEALPEREVATVKAVQQELLAREVVVILNKEAAELVDVHSSIAAEANVKNMLLVAAEFKEEDLVKALKRAEKVTVDISKNYWTVERVFASFDSDGNGELDGTELPIALAAMLGREISAAECGQVMKKFDADGDGKISYDEFAAVVKGYEKSVSGFLGSMFGGKGGEAGEKAKAVVVKKEQEGESN